MQICRRDEQDAIEAAAIERVWITVCIQNDTSGGQALCLRPD